MPKISIIVPVYNVETYLKNCIESILNQTFTDFELILVNDGSKDKSLEICKYYESIDNRIIIIDKTNEGVSSARNAGLDIAIGEYIGFVDSDDYIHPKMYENLYNQIKESKSDISVCGFEYVYNFNSKLLNTTCNIKESQNILSNVEALEKLRGEDAIAFTVVWNKLYKKDIFNNLRFKVGVKHEDEFIIHRLLYKANKISYKNNKLYFYLQRQGSIMKINREIRKINYLSALCDRVNFFYEKGLTDLQEVWGDVYIWELFKLYPKLKYIKYSNIKLILIRFEFLKLINILKKNKIYSLKIKISWIVFCISPYLYYKFIEGGNDKLCKMKNGR